MHSILVIGDSCKDVFVYCSCRRLAPEFPVQVLDTGHQVDNGGMAKNVQSNIDSLGVCCDIVTNDNWQSVTKTRYIDKDTNYMFIRVDSQHEKTTVDISEVCKNIKSYDAVVISDYDKGFLDYKNFPGTFKMYDPIAKVIPLYGWIYPFIESTLGLAFLIREQLYIALIISLIILVITTVGVATTLMRKESIQCACLGTALKLPMTTATIIENSIMLFMTVWMLINF